MIGWLLTRCQPLFPAWYQARWLLLILILTGAGGLVSCRAGDSPPSPAARAFQEEIFPLILELQKELVEPVKLQNPEGIQQALSAFYNRHGRLCRDCPFQISVIDGQGQLLTTYPKLPLSGNFADYRLINEPLTRRRIVQGRIFMPDGSSSYIISIPLVQKGRTVGVAVLNFTTAEVERRWGMTAKEFLSLNLNQPPE